MNEISISNPFSGEVECLSGRVYLAPMAGITDKSFRLLAEEAGAALTVTEMVSAKAITYDNKKTFELFDLSDERGPTAVQLFGSEPEVFVRAAEVLVEQGVQIIDVNMGCPVPKVVRLGEGSALMRDPKKAALIIRSLARAVRVPITVKFRKGWNDDEVNAVELAQRLEDAGAAAFTVHGRTREQYYAGESDREIIRLVKENTSIPVFASGDIFDVSGALQVLEETGVDALTVARGALGRPWLFTELNAALAGEEIPQPPELTEIFAHALRHAKLIVHYKGEVRGIKEMRKHLGWYFKGLPGAAKRRAGLNALASLEELEEYLSEYRHSLSRGE